jgi:hypothetical protein
VLLVALGCGDPAGGGATTGAASRPAPGSAAAPASATAAPKPAWIGIDRSAEQVEAVLNPKKQPAYAGPVGTLRGRITIVGDPAPETRHGYASECAGAAAIYGKAFRTGQVAGGGEGLPVADVLVAVTGYEGFVPPLEPAVKVTIGGCAFDRRTYALAYGQRLEVRNEDAKLSFMPYLMGAPLRAYMVAMPKGNPVKLYPLEPGATRYLLRDQMDRPYMAAEVYVLKYATHAVTGLDGLYEIARIPTGKVRVDAFLPSIDRTEGKEIEITEGVNQLDLELRFDAKKDRVVELPLDPLIPAAPSASAGAPPVPH